MTEMRTWTNSSRRTSCTLAKNGSTLVSQGYTYDNAGRLHTATEAIRTATYGYLANSPLVEQIEFRQSDTLRMTTLGQYDTINRLTGISHQASGGTMVSSHGYAYNAANQRHTVTKVE